ncbi:MAG TPA: hypothetical protein VIH60_01060 [Steroidobacteraceae bacterium]
MKIQYPRSLPWLVLAVAGLFLLNPLMLRQSMRIGGWSVVLCAVLCIVFVSIYFYRYSIEIDDEYLSESAFSVKRYRVSEITEVNVEIGRGARFAGVKFQNGEKVGFSSSLVGFDEFVALLRQKAKLAKPAWE